MDQAAENYIAGWKTPADWYAVRDQLRFGEPAGWEIAFAEFFHARLSTRYLDPIKTLQIHGSKVGEGFSIVAVQCSIVEFLESTVQGKSYRQPRRGASLGEYEYSSSQATFISFLSNRAPFSETFDAESSLDFYSSVRCGLLHEAMTKNGWKIWAYDEYGRIADVQKRIVFRDDFQRALLTFVNAYGKRLPTDIDLQKAFVRKFDHLCG